jgi:hypothetical protein
LTQLYNLKLKFLEENIVNNFCDLRLGKDFLDLTPILRPTIDKVEELISSKLEQRTEWRHKAQTGREHFVSHV